MAKRMIYIIIAVIGVALIASFFLFIKPQDKYAESSAFKAVSPSSTLILKINKPLDLVNQIGQNEMVNTIKTIPDAKILIDDITQLRLFVQKDERYQKILNDGDVFITLNYSGRDNITPLFLIALGSKNDIDLANRIIGDIKNDPSLMLKTRKYNKAIVNEITSKNSLYFFTLHKGILIISYKSLIIEEAIRQLDTDAIENNGGLSPLIKTVGQQADINLFINHKNIDRLVAKMASSDLKKKVSQLKTYAGWTELDINFGKNKVVMGGFTNGDYLENYFSNVLYHQQPVNPDIEKVLPQSTLFFTGLYMSDVETYFKDYTDYLEKQNLYFQREDKLLKIEKETGTKIQDVFKNLIDKEVVCAGITVDQANPKSGRVWIVGTKSGSTALSQMIKIRNGYLNTYKLTKNEWEKIYSIDSQTHFHIYRFPYSNLPKIIFGQIFSGVTSNWFAEYNNYLIFGDSFRTVSKALHSNVLGETLSSSTSYNRFKADLNSRCNLMFYSNTAIAQPVADIFFNKELAHQISNNDDLRKFKSFSWQVTSTGNMLYNNACLIYNPVIKSKPQTIWQSHIDAPFDVKPKFVINHNDRQNKEIVLQDETNNFYLINNVGRIVWKIKPDGPIIGEVYQIDYYQNGKLQYLFNTANKLYLIDRNGNRVENFPVELRSKATNGVAVFDYDNNKDYRFFLAGTNHNIYAYNKDGNLLKGWRIFHTDHEVTQPVQHFRVEGKDYIVASDLMKDYILHRKGTVRVKTSEVYPHSPNNTIYLEERTSSHGPRLVTTDTGGALHYIYLENGKQETMKTESMGKNHYFVAENIDSDEETEYIFADKNQLFVFDSDGKVILKKKFDATISHQPNIYTLSHGIKKIGITCCSINKIYLLDIEGNIYQGFPLDGCTQFSIGFISNEMSNFNLLVGSPDGYLYNYYVGNL